MRQKPGQFSILSLLLLAASVALLFAATRHFGAFGFVFGVLMMMVAIGQMFHRRNWQLGGIAGALMLILILPTSWCFYGTLKHVDYRYVFGVRDRFDMLDRWLDYHYKQHGEYPEQLGDLDVALGIGGFQMHTAADAAGFFEYEKTESGYRVMYLGENHQRGGEAHDADLSRQQARALGSQRVSYRQFLLETPGSPGLNLVMIFSLVAAFSIAAGASPEKNSRATVLSVSLFVVVAVVAGVFMTGFHIIAAQSGH